MANDKIDAILAKKKTEAAPGEGGKFFSIPALGDTEEKFLELQFKNGVNTCFSFSLLTWFNHDPDSGYIDLNIAGFWVAIKGRGLKPLFHGLKNKQVAWIKEADSEMQDSQENDSYIAEIIITPPEGFEDEQNTTE